MTYGDNERVGIYRQDHGERLLVGEVKNKLMFVSGLSVHEQKWEVWVGKARVQCDTFFGAMRTASKMAKRIGEDSVFFSEMEMGKYAQGVLRREFKSDYVVGQKVQLDIPVAHSAFTGLSECISAECEVLEICSIGNNGWWIRMGYENGEFAALEEMDGQLSVQAPVGTVAWQAKDDEFLLACEKGVGLHVCKYGVRII